MPADTNVETCVRQLRSKRIEKFNRIRIDCAGTPAMERVYEQNIGCDFDFGFAIFEFSQAFKVFVPLKVHNY